MLTTDTESVPAMPTITDSQQHHRVKMSTHPLAHMALVARAVGRQEMLSNEDARKAVLTEWLALHGKVWDFHKARSKLDVIDEAHNKG